VGEQPEPAVQLGPRESADADLQCAGGEVASAFRFTERA
jgi:hypothetical protein